MPYENSLFDDRRRFTLKDQSLQSQLTNLVDHCCSSGCVFYAEQSAKPALDSDIAPVVTITKLYVFKGVFTVELGLVHGLESMHGVDAFSEIEKGLADRATEA